MGAIEVHDAELDGVPVRWRSAPGPDPGRPPVLWLHGVPDASEMWTPFLERVGGIAPDLPGFGRSGKTARQDYSLEGWAAFVERFLSELGVDRVRLGMHDWGAAGLLWAQRNPGRVERLVALDVVPLLPGLRWHRTARLWRTRGLGELLMGFTEAGTLRRQTGRSGALEGVLEHFDHGTQRAILRLHRAGDPARLAAAGVGLGEIGAPGLVLWGERDHWFPPAWAERLAGALGAEAEVVPGAGHWPWLDRPEVVERATVFLRG